jgi:branched-chain amino acid transport system substrate-binding protein
MKNNILLSVAIITILIAVLVLGGCSAKEEVPNTTIEDSNLDTTENVKSVKIGVMLPLTGGAASYGVGVQKGLELANKDGTFTLVYEDSKCDPKEAVTSVNKLISVDGVQAIIGELCSGATLASVPVAEENKVVMISSASTSPDLSGKSSYFFRTIPSDAFQGKFAAELVKNAGHQKLAIVYSNEDYGLGLKGVLEASFEELGGEVVAAESFETDSVDLSTQITKIKEAKPDAIFYMSNAPPGTIAALEQTKELGIEAALYGAESLYGDEVKASDAASGITVVATTSGTSAYRSDFEAEYGESAPAFSAQAYDAYNALKLVIESGASNGEEIANALRNLNFEGATGSVDFDESGDVAAQYDVYTLTDGEWVLQS